jgi:hypothetical protein
MVEIDDGRPLKTQEEEDCSRCQCREEEREEKKKKRKRGLKKKKKIIIMKTEKKISKLKKKFNLKVSRKSRGKLK